MPQIINTEIKNSFEDAEKKDRFYGYLIFGLSSISVILTWILYQL